MCTEPKGPFHLETNTRGITTAKALSIIMLSHTAEYTIETRGKFVTISRNKNNDCRQMQLPEHTVARIAKLLPTLPPHPRNTRVRALEANYPDMAEAFAVAWGCTRAPDRKVARMLSIRRLALIIGFIEDEGISFGEATKKAQNPNYHEAMLDHD